MESWCWCKGERRWAIGENDGILNEDRRERRARGDISNGIIKNIQEHPKINNTSIWFVNK